MNQQQLSVSGSAAAGYLRAMDDYGPVGTGASQAHYVLAENGQEYIAKGPSLSPMHSHVAANELIAARLGQHLGLPILDFQVVDLAGELVFASGWMEKPTFHPQTNAALFRSCENRDRAYDLVVFDCWLVNPDRHHENLVVRVTRQRGTGSPRHFLLLNDHSHCLVQPNEQAAALAGRVDAPPHQYVTLDFIREAIEESQRLRHALDAVEAVTDETIGNVVAQLPASFLPDPAEAPLMRDFLIARRGRLADVLRANRTWFPNLDGGAL